MNLNVNQIINKLNNFFYEQNCSYFPSYPIKKGAGTLNIHLLIKLLKNIENKMFTIEYCQRPNDSFNSSMIGCRLNNHLQFQVLITSKEKISLDIFSKCMEYIGLQDYTFIPDNWSHKTLLAFGKGWEVQYSGFEFAQVTFFKSIGGIDLEHYVLELTFGIERIAMILQNKTNIKDVQYDEINTYKDIFFNVENECSLYQSNINVEKKIIMFNSYIAESKKKLEEQLPILSLEALLNSSHLFNEIEEYISNFEAKKMLLILTSLIKKTLILIKTS